MQWVYYPFNYQDLLNCTYYVYAETNDVTTNATICFRFARFDLEQDKDFLVIYEREEKFVYSGVGEATRSYTDPNRKHVWSDNFCCECYYYELFKTTMFIKIIVLGEEGGGVLHNNEYSLQLKGKMESIELCII